MGATPIWAFQDCSTGCNPGHGHSAPPFQPICVLTCYLLQHGVGLVGFGRLLSRIFICQTVVRLRSVGSGAHLTAAHIRVVEDGGQSWLISIGQPVALIKLHAKRKGFKDTVITGCLLWGLQHSPAPRPILCVFTRPQEACRETSQQWRGPVCRGVQEPSGDFEGILLHSLGLCLCPAFGGSAARRFRAVKRTLRSATDG